MLRDLEEDSERERKSTCADSSKFHGGETPLGDNIIDSKRYKIQGSYFRRTI